LHARTAAPTLSSASVRAGGVAAVRIVVGVAFVLGSALRGLDGGPAVLAALGGALVLAVIALGQRSRSGPPDFGDALAVPPGARFDPGWVGVLLACIPSTVGVTIMAVVAVVVAPALAALLGGVLIALGALAAVFWVQLAARERREQTRYLVERGPRPRVYTAPNGFPGVTPGTPRSGGRA
jgi:Na+/H+ antiporter NhaD/arsenite permease-like protein